MHGKAPFGQPQRKSACRTTINARRDSRAARTVAISREGGSEVQHRSGGDAYVVVHDLGDLVDVIGLETAVKPIDVEAPVKERGDGVVESPASRGGKHRLGPRRRNDIGT